MLWGLLLAVPPIHNTPAGLWLYPWAPRWALAGVITQVAASSPPVDPDSPPALGPQRITKQDLLKHNGIVQYVPLSEIYTFLLASSGI